MVPLVARSSVCETLRIGPVVVGDQKILPEKKIQFARAESPSFRL